MRRSAKGELKEVLPKGTQGKDVSQESLMYLEIDRCANAGELRVLEKAILEVLGEVRVTVADFEPMKAKARELLAWLGKAKLKVPAEELRRKYAATWNGCWTTTSPSSATRSSPSPTRAAAVAWSTTRSPSSA